MRLHRLVLTGVGPFKGRQEIDFDAVEPKLINELGVATLLVGAYGCFDGSQLLIEAAERGSMFIPGLLLRWRVAGEQHVVHHSVKIEVYRFFSVLPVPQVTQPLHPALGAEAHAQQQPFDHGIKGILSMQNIR